MADFFGKSRQVNGTFARSAQAEALKKRFLSSNAHGKRKLRTNLRRDAREGGGVNNSNSRACSLSLPACGRFLRATRSESAESQTGGCIDAAAGDRFFRASAGSRARL